MTARELIEKLQSAPEYLDCPIELVTDDGTERHLIPLGGVTFLTKQTSEGWTDKRDSIELYAFEEE